MEIEYRPIPERWKTLCKRAELDRKDLSILVQEIFVAVQKYGDQALKEYTEKFDGCRLNDLRLDISEMRIAAETIDKSLKDAMQLAYENITKFHESQHEKVNIVNTSSGVKCWRESRAVEKVGIYIPGGSAPLFSTVLMLGIPAKMAGCREVILCTPPDKDGNINPAILNAALLVGIDQVYTVGGAQAIAAMTFGTQSINRCDKIFGPGNQYVTMAKQMAQHHGVAIDMPAGPSELLIIADETANPDFIAADLLSQAEHGADSQVILLSDSEQLVRRSLDCLYNQIKQLPRQAIAEKALKNSRAIVFDTIDQCISFSNMYAPEHLIVATRNYNALVPKIINAGSVFLGNYSCESAGDYASGTNHTLPTNAYSRNYSGVSLDSFIKKITFQELSADGIRNIGPAIEIMAMAEDLQAHKNAVTIRLDYLNQKIL